LSQQNQIKRNIPWMLFQDTYALTNYGSGVTVITSDKIPDGFIFIAKDTNTIFTTAGGGVTFRIITRGGKRTNYTGEFTSTSTGLNNLVLEQGGRVQMFVSTTGVGVVDLVWHGELVPITSANELRREEQHIFAFGDGL